MFSLVEEEFGNELFYPKNDRHGHHSSMGSVSDNLAMFASQKSVNFRSLKGNRRSIEKNAQIYSSNYPNHK